MFGGEAALGKTGLQREEKDAFGGSWRKASGEAEFAFGRAEAPDPSKQKTQNLEGLKLE